MLKSLSELAQRLPRAFDDLAKLHPDAAEQTGWIALDIGKTLVWHSAGTHKELHTAADNLRAFALSLLGEKSAGRTLAPAECPMLARVSQLEAIIKAREAA
jgi:hypothetical protein